MTDSLFEDSVPRKRVKIVYNNDSINVDDVVKVDNVVDRVLIDLKNDKDVVLWFPDAPPRHLQVVVHVRILTSVACIITQGNVMSVTEVPQLPNLYEPRSHLIPRMKFHLRLPVLGYVYRDPRNAWPQPKLH